VLYLRGSVSDEDGYALVRVRFDFWLICHGFSLFRKSGCTCHDFSNLVGLVFTHTHTHCMSWASYLHYFGRVTFVSVILVYHLHVFIILTCSMTSFSDRNTCVCYNTCEGSYFVAFSLFSKFSVSIFDNCWTYITLFHGSFWDR
jgi:hypothetical protein